MASWVASDAYRFAAEQAVPCALARAFSAEDQKVLEKIAAALECPKRPMPWWASLILSVRDMFRCCALAEMPEEFAERFPAEIWVIQMAMCGSDPELQLAKAILTPHDIDSSSNSTHAAQPGLNTNRVFYQFDYKVLAAVEVPLLPDAALVVLPGLLFCSGGVSCSVSPVLFEAFTAGLAGKQHRAGGGAARIPKPLLSDGMRDRLLAEYPWLSDDDFRRAAAAAYKAAEESEGAPARGGARAGAGEGPAAARRVLVPLEEEEEEVVEAIMDRLQREREAWSFEEEAADNFYVFVPGGRWAEKFLRQISDQFIAKARAHCHLFCAEFNWPKQRGFGRIAYGEDNAFQLACEMCRRGNFFYSVWEGSDRQETFEVDPEAWGYTEPLDFIEWACEVDIESRTFDSIMQIRHLFPCKRPE